MLEAWSRETIMIRRIPLLLHSVFRSHLVLVHGCAEVHTGDPRP
jgi:hypothetical protein